MRTVQITFDAVDPGALARFWAAALHAEVQPAPEGYDSWEAFLTEIGVPEDQWNDRSAVVDPAGNGPRLFFQRVETGQTHSAVHLDLSISEGPGAHLETRKAAIETEVKRLEALGGRRKRTVARGEDYWVVMTDPEGNAFCLQ